MFHVSRIRFQYINEICLIFIESNMLNTYCIPWPKRDTHMWVCGYLFLLFFLRQFFNRWHHNLIFSIFDFIYVFFVRIIYFIGMDFKVFVPKKRRRKKSSNNRAIVTVKQFTKSPRMKSCFFSSFKQNGISIFICGN